MSRCWWLKNLPSVGQAGPNGLRWVRRNAIDPAGKIHSLCSGLRSSELQSTFRLPDFESWVPFDQVSSFIAREPSQDRQAVRTLWLLGGSTVGVVKDRGGPTIIDYKDRFPDDFQPVLILDASGRVRSTYRLWEEGRKTLRVLPAGRKRYKNLRIHVWKTGGGKAAFRTGASKLIEGIAATINTKPEESWLVVLHKEEPGRSSQTDTRPKTVDPRSGREPRKRILHNLGQREGNQQLQGR